MTCSKPRFAFLRESAAKSARKKFRPQVEMLENRLQPSLTGMALDGIEAHPIAESEPVSAVAHTITADGIKDMLSVSTATYITGTTGSATARGVALGQDGSTYQAGTITVNGSEVAYAAKYDPNGTQIFLAPIQLVDSNNNNLNTEGDGVAVDGLGNIYLGGTFIDAAGAPHSYGLKLSADGTTIVWLHNFQGGSTTNGIAVTDPNNNGTGHVVWTGTLTITDPSTGPVGDHIVVASFTTDGTRDYAFFYTFTGTTASQGKGVALNTNSTFSTPGSLAYAAGNVVLNGNQQTLAFVVNETNGNGTFARTLTNTSTSDTLTGVAVNPDDSSVYSGTVATSSGNVGILVGYGADGSVLIPPTLLANALTLNAITVDATGNIYVTGAATNASNGGVYVATLDANGNLLSEAEFGGTGTVDAGYGIAVTSTGTLWVVGDTTSSTLSTDGTVLVGPQDGFLASVKP